MRKLIEREQPQAIVCDNVNCNFQIANNEDEVDSRLYVDMPCPKCGDNLLTLQDYNMHEKLIKTVDFINKWFSWLTLFSGKVKKEDMKGVSVHVHDGIKVSPIKNIVEEVNIEREMQCQLGLSATADFEELTWTFEMNEDFTVSAGEFVIMPKEIYDQTIVKLRTIQELRNMPESSVIQITRRTEWLLNKLKLKN